MPQTLARYRTVLIDLDREEGRQGLLGEGAIWLRRRVIAHHAIGEGMATWGCNDTGEGCIEELNYTMTVSILHPVGHVNCIRLGMKRERRY